MFKQSSFLEFSPSLSRSSLRGLDRVGENAGIEFEACNNLQICPCTSSSQASSINSESHWPRGKMRPRDSSNTYNDQGIGQPRSLDDKGILLSALV